ncbi:MAG TPA: thiamine phosphate synthase, partial [Dissulfurispiraceae bacterium]|nr:thiamine phosphate synthase [Dissulfurispiraceae bacterium]
MLREIGFRVYLVTDRRLFSGIDGLLEGIEEALKGGVKAVQVREKDLTTRELLSLSYRMRDVTGRYGASLFINDRADIALAVGAEGVHLGQASMPVRAVRKVLPDDMLIGVSTHSVEEALQAEEERADFITIGPVFPTPSKLRYGA